MDESQGRYADTIRYQLALSYKKMNDYVHTHSQAKTFFHSCGSIRILLNDFIDAGVDIINPIQASAKGMEVGGLKKDFRDRLIFWGGGVDSQNTLQFGTKQEVSAQVRERVNIMGAGGGFVFAADHNIQHTVPPENVLTMFDTAYEAGKELYQR